MFDEVLGAGSIPPVTPSILTAGSSFFQVGPGNTSGDSDNQLFSVTVPRRGTLNSFLATVNYLGDNGIHTGTLLMRIRINGQVVAYGSSNAWQIDPTVVAQIYYETLGMVLGLQLWEGDVISLGIQKDTGINIINLSASLTVISQGV